MQADHPGPSPPPFPASKARVSLLERDLAECPVLNRSLAAWQQEAQASVGMDASADSRLQLSFDASLFFSEGFLKSFIDDACAAGLPCAAAVDVGLVHQAFGRNAIGLGRSCDASTLAYPMVLSQRGASGAEPRLVRVRSDASSRATTQPGRSASPALLVADTRFVWRIAHWSDILVVNLVMLETSRQQRRVDENNQGNGQGVEIHPTAVVLRSRLGDGVKIGPFALVRDAVLGDGVELQEYASVVDSIVAGGSQVQCYAQVRGSVVGENCVMSFHTATRNSVFVGNTTNSAPVVARCLVGDRVFLSRGTRIAASNLDNRTIHVRHAGQVVDTGIEMLGAAIGSGARLGDLSLPPGYEVPPGCILTTRGLSPLPPDPPRGVPLTEVNGVFRNLSLRREDDQG